MSAQDDRGEVDGLAPVIPLFGSQTGASVPNARRVASDRRGVLPEQAAPEARGHRVAFTADSATGGREAARREPASRWPDAPESEPAEVDSEALARAASDALLKKLRSRSLSEREARTFLVQQDLSDDAVEQIVDDMLRLGYLDDAALAEQVVHIAVTRRGEGRAAIALALSRRGIPREVADEAVAAVGDDDAERALEYARRKVSSVSGRDDETALRRLVGQLARRGYPSGIALTAARQALRERRPVLRGPRFD